MKAKVPPPARRPLLDQSSLDDDAAPQEPGGVEDLGPEFAPWYNQLVPLPARDIPEDDASSVARARKNATKLEQLFTNAKASYDTEAEEYAKTGTR